MRFSRRSTRNATATVARTTARIVVLLAAADRAMFHAKRASLGLWFASDNAGSAAATPEADLEA